MNGERDFYFTECKQMHETENLKQDQHHSRDAGKPSSNDAHLLSTECGRLRGGGNGSRGDRCIRSVPGIVSSGGSSGDSDVGAADIGGDVGRGEDDVGALIEGRISSVVRNSAKQQRQRCFDDASEKDDVQDSRVGAIANTGNLQSIDVDVETKLRKKIDQRRISRKMR